MVHVKGMLTHGFAKKHYGQWAEDVALTHIFGKQQSGFYIDVGAFHPKHYSNTYLLYKRGWHGINIDPNYASIALFRWYRPRDINLMMGIGQDEGKKTYYEFNHQSCNTFSREQMEHMRTKKFVRYLGERNVPCMPLKNVIAEYAAGKTVDLLNIDVEGLGLDVLRSIDWELTTIRVICVEDDAFDSVNPQRSEIYTFLRDHGYTLSQKVGLSCIYMQK